MMASSPTYSAEGAASTLRVQLISVSWVKELAVRCFNEGRSASSATFSAVAGAAEGKRKGATDAELLSDCIGRLAEVEVVVHEYVVALEVCVIWHFEFQKLICVAKGGTESCRRRNRRLNKQVTNCIQPSKGESFRHAVDKGCRCFHYLNAFSCRFAIGCKPLWMNVSGILYFQVIW